MSYPSWHGSFYPKAFAPKHWLKFYSKIFNVTEINSSFYKIPAKPVAAKWYHDTPLHFAFTLKFPRIITHDSKLDLQKSWNELHSFIMNLSPLKSKITALVLQMSPSMTFDEAQTRLEILSKHLPSFYRYAIEGRHNSWFYDESLEYLREKRWCLVWNEVPIVENPVPVTTDFVYLRIIGDREIPEKSFGRLVLDNTLVLQKWAYRLKQISGDAKIKQAFVLSNNHLEGLPLRRQIGLDK